MNLVDLEPDDPRFVEDALPVLRQLRPHLTPQSAAAVYHEGLPQGLRFYRFYEREGFDKASFHFARVVG